MPNDPPQKQGSCIRDPMVVMKNIFSFLAAGATVVFSMPASTTAAVPEGASPYEDVRAYVEAMMLILDSHVEQSDVKQLTYAAIEGMISSLDPYSNYLQSDEFASLSRATSGNMVGIGIVVSVTDGKWTVDYPVPGSPAFQAGIAPGDQIVAIDSVDLEGKTMKQIMELISGEIGSIVVLTIARGDSEPSDFTVRRTAVETPALQSPHMIDGSNIAYVCISRFSSGSASAFIDALDTFEDNKAEALVIDLRDNPGGLISEALLMADAILPPGKTITKIKGRPGVREPQTIESSSTEMLSGRHIALLVNGGSASAAELLAAAIKDNDRGRIFGSKTFGKASVQTIFQMVSRPDEGALLTTAYYYTPKDVLINGKGISPDFAVPQSSAELRDSVVKRLFKTHPELCGEISAYAKAAASRDAPLEAAVIHLNQLISTQKQQSDSAAPAPDPK